MHSTTQKVTFKESYMNIFSAMLVIQVSLLNHLSSIFTLFFVSTSSSTGSDVEENTKLHILPLGPPESQTSNVGAGFM